MSPTIPLVAFALTPGAQRSRNWVCSKRLLLFPRRISQIVSPAWQLRDRFPSFIFFFFFSNLTLLRNHHHLLLRIPWFTFSQFLSRFLSSLPSVSFSANFHFSEKDFWKVIVTYPSCALSFSTLIILWFSRFWQLLYAIVRANVDWSRGKCMKHLKLV